MTINAMGRQKNIVQAIIDKKAHYVLMVKDNQGELEARKAMKPLITRSLQKQHW